MVLDILKPKGPWPSRDSSSMLPPIISTSSRQIASPSPLPARRCGLSACSKRWNRRAWLASGMPGPVSLTLNCNPSASGCALSVTLPCSVVLPLPEAAAVLVVDGEPGGDAAGPDAIVAIDEQGIGLVGRQRPRVAHHVPEHLEVHAIEARQAAGRAEPEQAVAVLRHRIDRPAGQAVGGAVAAELGRRQRPGRISTGCRGSGEALGRGGRQQDQRQAQQPSGQSRSVPHQPPATRCHTRRTRVGRSHATNAR